MKKSEINWQVVAVCVGVLLFWTVVGLFCFMHARQLPVE